MEETIIAPITAPGHAAVGLIRLSGPSAKELALKLCSDAKRAIESPRSQILTEILNPNSKEAIDSGLVTFFKAPNSFTGEDVIEVALHGSPYLSSKFLELAQELGARLAAPGEFSKRAYLNGKVDLSQSEAILDLINSETELQAKMAKRQLSGELRGVVSDFGEPLRDLVAEVEAYIDFPEEDIEPEKPEQWSRSLTDLINQAQKYLESFSKGKVLRLGAEVCICGKPNAGKSSLLNALVGDQRAIVTDIPGTTRDSIEVRLQLDGLLVKLWDTAGLETGQRQLDEVERIGIEKSKKRVSEADLVLLVVDQSAQADAELEELLASVRQDSRDLLLIGNKSDLSGASHQEVDLLVSAKTGAGVSELCKQIRQRLIGNNQASFFITNQRHADCLSKTRDSLELALRSIAENQAPELIAFEIRQALTSLDDIIGITTTEDILGRIYSKFCVGK